MVVQWDIDGDMGFFKPTVLYLFWTCLKMGDTPTGHFKTEDDQPSDKSRQLGYLLGIAGLGLNHGGFANKI